MEAKPKDQLGIDDILAEPIVRLMMKADRLNEFEVRIMLFLVADDSDKIVRSSQWAKFLDGNRPKALDWLRIQERRITEQLKQSKAAE